jgi:hypothetical protein
MVVSNRDSEIKRLRDQVATLLQREKLGTGSELSDTIEGRALRYSEDGRDSESSMSDDGSQGGSIGRLSMPNRPMLGQSASMDAAFAGTANTPVRGRSQSVQDEGGANQPTPLNAVTGLNPSILHLMQGANRSVLGDNHRQTSGSIGQQPAGAIRGGANALLENMGALETRTSAIRRRSIERESAAAREV